MNNIIDKNSFLLICNYSIHVEILSQCSEIEMHITIEYYRVRQRDQAHALLGRERVEIADVAAALRIAGKLAVALDMPQQPDAMTITDRWGTTIYAGPIDGSAIEGAPLTKRDVVAIGVWENEGGATEKAS